MALKVQILCVGKLKEAFWRDACGEYSRRLGRFCQFSIVETEEERLPEKPSPAQIAKALQKEGERLLSAVPPRSMTAALCVEGKLFTSEGVARLMEKAAMESGSLVFFIGSSWGLSEKVKQSAAVRLSMSSMTFPHQLARVMLCEQLYRGETILSGTMYHK